MNDLLITVYGTPDIYPTLTILSSAGFHQTPNGTKIKLVSVRCGCGKEFITRLSSLTREDGKRTTSCGCRKRQAQKMARPPVHLIHGLAKRNSKRWYMYNAWMGIKQRCYNPKDKYFHCYGGRGITLCEEWFSNAERFCSEVISELGQRPRGKSLDRINNDGNYEPGNLRWATAAEQGKNRRPRSEWGPSR